MSLPKPQSRIEAFLNVIATGGDLNTLPEAQSRIEVYLDYIARNINKGNDIDLSAYATKEDLKSKADVSHTHDTYASKTNEHTHTNKTTIDNITDVKVSTWDNKVDANHTHDTYSEKQHRHNASDIDNLPSI